MASFTWGLNTAHLFLAMIFCATILQCSSPPHHYCFCKYCVLLVHHLLEAFFLLVHALHVCGHGWKVQSDGRTAVRWNGGFICRRDLLTGSQHGAYGKNDKPLLLSLFQTLFTLDVRKLAHPFFDIGPQDLGYDLWLNSHKPGLMLQILIEVWSASITWNLIVCPRTEMYF